MTTCQYKCAPNRRHLLFSFKWIGHFSFSLNFSITFRTHTTPTSLSTVYYNSICWDSLGEKTHFYNFIHVSDLFPIFRWLRFKTNYSTTWNYGRFFYYSKHLYIPSSYIAYHKSNVFSASERKESQESGRFVWLSVYIFGMESSSKVLKTVILCFFNVFSKNVSHQNIKIDWSLKRNPKLLLTVFVSFRSVYAYEKSLNMVTLHLHVFDV